MFITFFFFSDFCGVSTTKITVGFIFMVSISVFIFAVVRVFISFSNSEEISIQNSKSLEEFEVLQDCLFGVSTAGAIG